MEYKISHITYIRYYYSWNNNIIISTISKAFGQCWNRFILKYHYNNYNIHWSLFDADECADVSCQNGGSCYNTVDGSVCMCTPGYEGLFCQSGKELFSNIIVHTNSLTVRANFHPTRKSDNSSNSCSTVAPTFESFNSRNTNDYY